jgi:UDPglucose 6-dehydrogenase
MKITIIGAGYVGLTTATSLAYLGHQVSSFDKDTSKIESLKKQISPIHELGMNELLILTKDNITFSSTFTTEMSEADVFLIAVGTPTMANGDANIGYVESAAREVAQQLKSDKKCTFVIKSTVPIGTNQRVKQIVNTTLRERNIECNVTFASNPEFLRESRALYDTFFPDRIVVGSDDIEAIDILNRMYRHLLNQDFQPPSFLTRPDDYKLPTMITTDLVSAEIIKYAANAFLATKISFINEMAGLCEKIGADVTEIARGIGQDHRIGKYFLDAGPGWGGSCFPKDTSAILAVAKNYNYDMPIISAAREVNNRQRLHIIERLQDKIKVIRGRNICILGLAFKPNTDDVRDSPAIDIIRILQDRGAHIIAHDPIAINNAIEELGTIDIDFKNNAEDAAEHADALIILTEWPEYNELDWKRIAILMKTPIVIDARNQLSPEKAIEAGLDYTGIGR